MKQADIRRIVRDMSPVEVPQVTGCMVFPPGQGSAGRDSDPRGDYRCLPLRFGRDAAIAIRTDGLTHQYGHVVVEYVIAAEGEERTGYIS
jgi:hypothetical protein